MKKQIWILTILLIISLSVSFIQIPEVKADSTFGKTDIGGQNYTGANDRIYLLKATLTEDATVTKISFYGRSYSGSNYMQCAIYNSDGEPDELEGVSAEVLVSTTLQWWNFTCDISLTPAVYWIGWNQKTEGSSPRYYFDTVSTASRYTSDEYDDGFPNPIGSMNSLDKEISIFATYTTEGGETFELNPSINVDFSLSAIPQFYGTYPVTSSIDLTFNLESTMTFFQTYFVFPSIDLVFDLSSTLEKITGYVYSIFPSIELTFDLSSVQTFFGHYMINPIINVNFGLSEFTEWISGIIHIYPSIVIVFDLNNIVSGGIVKGYETSHAIALAIIAFVLAIIGICIAVTKKD